MPIWYDTQIVALIHMVHKWMTGTDGNGATVRTILPDY